MTARLDRHVAIVTGASGGIGEGVARAMAREGAAIVVNFHSHGEKANAIAAGIERAGGRALTVQADVSYEADVARMFDEAAAAFGRVDVLIANSGIQKDAPIADMTLADWKAVLDVDLTGQFLCCREAVRRFRAQDPAGRPARAAGAIVSMSSVHERIPWAGHINYAASKGGIRMMVQTLAQEVSVDRIRVNAIAPGAIKTDINKSVWNDKDKLGQLLTLIPYGRIGEVEDVAAAAVFLASDEADYVTGATLFVDGGMALYPSFRDNG